MPDSRLAILGAGGAHRSEDAWARAAMRLGHEARVFDVLRQVRRWGAFGRAAIARAIEQFEPDHILCTRHAIHLGATRLARMFRGRTSMLWHLDIAPQPGVLELARLCQITYTTVPSRRDAYRAAGAGRVLFMPQAMDVDSDKPAVHAPDEFRCEISFVGSGGFPDREPVLRAMAREFDLQIRGSGWDDPNGLPVRGGSVHGARFAQVVAAAALSLGANGSAAQDAEYASASNRMWKVFGAAGAYLGRRVDGIDQFARHGEHCCWYSDIDDCIDQARGLLRDPQGRAAMAQRARAHALAHHTYDARLRLILAGQEYPLR